MFSEWLAEGDFIISPRVTFDADTRVLGGLLSLGYQVGFLLKRRSSTFAAPKVSKYSGITITIDTISELDGTFTQLRGTDHKALRALGEELGLTGSYDPRPYYKLVGIQQLLQNVDLGSIHGAIPLAPAGGSSSSDDLTLGAAASVSPFAPKKSSTTPRDDDDISELKQQVADLQR